MNLKFLKQSNLFICFLMFSSLATASGYQWVCDHYVTAEIPFCSVTLFVTEEGKLSPRASIEHQGQTHPSLIQELDLEPGQMLHLNLNIFHKLHLHYLRIVQFRFHLYLKNVLYYFHCNQHILHNSLHSLHVNLNSQNSQKFLIYF